MHNTLWTHSNLGVIQLQQWTKQGIYKADMDIDRLESNNLHYPREQGNDRPDLGLYANEMV